MGLSARGRRVVAVLAGAVLVASVAVLARNLLRERSVAGQGLAQAGVTPLGGRPAPSFTLTDQAGRQVSLADFQGRAVVLLFMDDRGIDVDPVMASEIAAAERSHPALRTEAAFVAVNVNPLHATPADLRAFDRLHNLSQLSNWHFLTGSPTELSAVWKAYGITVDVAPDGHVQHASYAYVLDASGRRRYLFEESSNRAYAPVYQDLIVSLVAKVKNGT